MRYQGENGGGGGGGGSAEGNMGVGASGNLGQARKVRERERIMGPGR